MMLSQRELDEKWQTEISGLLSTILEKAGKHKTTDDLHQTPITESEKLPSLSKYSSDPSTSQTVNRLSNSVPNNRPSKVSLNSIASGGREINSKISEVYEEDEEKPFKK